METHVECMHFLAQSPVYHIMPLVHGEHPVTRDLDLMQVELPSGAGCCPATMYEIADTCAQWDEAYRKAEFYLSLSVVRSGCKILKNISRV
jgi:hypothetical protein